MRTLARLAPARADRVLTSKITAAWLQSTILHSASGTIVGRTCEPANSGDTPQAALTVATVNVPRVRSALAALVQIGGVPPVTTLVMDVDELRLIPFRFVPVMTGAAMVLVPMNVAFARLASAKIGAAGMVTPWKIALPRSAEVRS